jgi:hypothetical protein
MKTKLNLSKIFHTEELSSSLALRILGALLLMNVIISFIYWGDMIYALAESHKDFAICWHDWDGCAKARIFSESGISSLRLISLGAAFGGLFLFLFNTAIGVATLCLAVAFAGKAFFHLQDFQFMGNPHYIYNIAVLIFLFARNKATAMKLFVVIVYFTTGLLRLNSEWLGGYALGPVAKWEMGPILTAAAFGIAFLELFLSWVLFSTNKILYWVTVALFAIFHFYSFWVVDYYFPVLSFSLLSIFIIDGWNQKFFAPKEVKQIGVPALAILSCFCVLQVIPRIQPGDTAITGEGRSISLNVFDTYPQCYFLMVAENKKQFAELPFDTDQWSPRTRCEPLLFLREAQRQCGDHENITISMLSRRSNSKAFTQICWAENICTQPPHLKSIGFNSWISSIEVPEEYGVLFRNTQTTSSNEGPSCDLQFGMDAWECRHKQTLVWSWRAPGLDAKAVKTANQDTVRLTTANGVSYELEAKTGHLVLVSKGPATAPK